jgi:hypothetical protein
VKVETLTELAGGVPALHPERRGQLDVSPKANWVERRGGLPPYINSVATALVRQGMTRSRAIATAVNVAKKTCATGLWGGNPKIKISGAIRSAACAAVAQWEAMKVSTSVPADERMAIELATRWEAEDSLELAWDRLRARALIDLTDRRPTLRERLRKLTGRGR